jgi:putative ABC transport system permease protein
VKGWAVAIRIARREAMRAKGRSLLVLSLIMLPVVALAFAAVTYDMFRLTPAEELERKIGRFDAQLAWRDATPVTQDAQGNPAAPGGGSGTPVRGDVGSGPAEHADADLLALLPAGSRVVRWGDEHELTVRTRTGVGNLAARGMDLRDPAFAGIVNLRQGRAPTGDAEVAINEAAARRLGVGIGGTVRLTDDSRQFTVVGLVEQPSNLRELLVLPPAALPTPAGFSWLADTPAPLDWAAVKALNRHGITAYSRAVVLDPPPDAASSPGAAAGAAEDALIAALIVGLGIVEVVLLAGPAFTVGARRRQRQLALVAASGGTPAHLRRIVLADGLVLGLAAAVVGVLIGIAVAVGVRPLLEESIASRRAGGVRVFPLALLGAGGVAVLTGLLAALVPAFVAARQDVLAALAGRRGVIRSRRRWIIAGLALLGIGAAITTAAALAVSPTLVTLGLVLAEFGLVLCTPALLGLVARAGRLLPLAPRIALRDTARNRASAASAISAVMAAVAGSVLIGVFMRSDERQKDQLYTPTMPVGYAAVVRNSNVFDRPATAVPVDRLERAARETLPVARTATVSQVACADGVAAGTACDLSPEMPAERRCPVDYGAAPPTGQQRQQLRKDPRCSDRFMAIMNSATLYTVDDGTALPLLSGATGEDLANAERTLRAGGVVVADARMVKDGKVTLGATMFEQNASPGEPRRFTVPGYALSTAQARELTVLSPAAVRQAGFRAEPFGIIVATTRMPTQAERDAAMAALQGLGEYYVSVEAPWRPDNLSLIILAAVAGMIALGAAAIATGLAAVDSRADLATLAAVGASPGLRRRLSLSQSGVIAGLGSLLGAATGLAAGFAVLAAFNSALAEGWPPDPPLPFTMPWSNVLIAVVVVPVVAMLGAGLLTRSRLPIERRL